MRALVTGATGFVGGHLAEKLLARGDEVHVLTRKDSETWRLSPRATIHRSSLTGPDLVETLSSIRPEIVFHLASRFQDRHEPHDIAGLIESNVTFGVSLAEAMLRAGCRHLVNTGTSWQHLGNADYEPVCLYAATKQALEVILRFFSAADGLQVITLKLFDTYGPNDRRGKLLASLKRIAAEGKTFDMSPGEQLLDLVHVADVVECFLLAADRLAAGLVAGMEEYAVSSGAPLRLRDLVDLFGRVAGSELRINWGARPYRPREVMVPWSTGPALPGWQPRIALEDGLRMVLA